MKDRVLIALYPNHPKGYGVINPEAHHSKYQEVWEEWVEDISLPTYNVGKKKPNWNEIPYVEIPCGTLKIWGLLKEPEVNMLRKTITIQDKDFYCEDDIYISWFNCRACKGDMIFAGASYCPDCGAKIKWDLSGEDL